MNQFDPTAADVTTLLSAGLSHRLPPPPYPRSDCFPKVDNSGCGCGGATTINGPARRPVHPITPAPSPVVRCRGGRSPALSGGQLGGPLALALVLLVLMPRGGRSGHHSCHGLLPSRRPQRPALVQTPNEVDAFSRRRAHRLAHVLPEQQKMRLYEVLQRGGALGKG